MKYSYSFDEERYSGEHDSVEAAANEAFGERPDATSCFVGENIAPTPAETYIDVDLFIEHVQQQEDYNNDWGGDEWPRATKEQKKEINTELSKVFGAWLDRHDLRPTFWTVDRVRRVDNPNPQEDPDPCN